MPKVLEVDDGTILGALISLTKLVLRSDAGKYRQVAHTYYEARQLIKSWGG